MTKETYENTPPTVDRRSCLRFGHVVRTRFAAAGCRCAGHYRYGPIPGWLRSKTGRAARLLPLLLWTLAATLQAQEYSFTATDGQITITRYTGPGGAVIIPSTIMGLPVTTIGNEAFAGRTNLSSVTIPNSVTSIESKAFYRCTGLASITIGNSVTNIGAWAFGGCSSLTGVTIPNSVTSIGEGAFTSCTSLTAIVVDALNSAYSSLDGVLFNRTQSTLIQYPTGNPQNSYAIPNGVTRIGDGAFSRCGGLTDVAIPDSVTSIGNWAFGGCSSLTAITVDALNSAYSSLDGVLFNRTQSTLIQYPTGNPQNSYAIPNGVSHIGNSAFSSCTNLTSVTIGNRVTRIGGGAFWGCGGLTDVAIPDSVTSIGDAAFSGCSSLSNLTIPNGVTRIGHGAFSDCAGLTSVTIGNRVTSIGLRAFEGCIGLTHLTIPNSVTSIGNGAFLGCSNLTLVVIPRPQPAAHPLVEEMLRDIQPAALHHLMRQITGEEPVFVGHGVAVLTNRFTGSAPFRKATQFAFDQLQALRLQAQSQDWERAWQSGPTYSDRNIIGIQPGVSRPEEIVVICAHFDAMPEANRAPGADDNASGSAAVLTAAQIFSQYRFERTIHYVLFTGEEQHGLGSQEYVAQAVAGGSNIVAVLAPDMIGYASSALEPPTCSLTTWFESRLGLEGASGSEIDAMFTLGFEIEVMFTNVVAMYGLSNTLSCSFGHPNPWGGVPSDAEFFFGNGYSTLFLTHAHENPRYHTGADTLDTLNLNYLTAMVQAIVGTAAHLAYPVDRNPFEVIEVVNSDWAPASYLGGGDFYAAFAVGASGTNVDVHDLPWSEATTNSPFSKELRIYSDPYGVPLQTDARPPGSDTLFRVKLAAADATGTGVSGNTRLRFRPLTPTGSNRVYLARVHVDGRYLVTGKDFDCVTNLHEVASAGGFLDLPSLVQVPDGAVYGTCDISARLLNQDPANCRLRMASRDSPSIVLSSTAQMGAHIIDDLEVSTNLAPPFKWTLLKSYTNVVSPDTTHFESGWTEVVREVDASLLPEGTSHFFRLKRIWVHP